MLAFVAAHGFTDFLSLSPISIGAYAVSFCVAHTSPWIVRWFLFLIASAVHFAQDGVALGMQEGWGALVVLIPTCLYIFGFTATAVRLMYAYLILVHIPIHYAKETHALGLAPPYGAFDVFSWATFGMVISVLYIKSRSLKSPWWRHIGRLDETVLIGAILGHTFHNIRP